MKRSLFVFIFTAAAFIAPPAAGRTAQTPTPPTVLQGAYALAEGTPKTRATLTVTPAAPLRADLDLAFYAPGGNHTRILDFDMELGRKLHLIVVSDDLHTTFEHLHPEPESDGRFHTTLTVPKAGLYHLYADATPHGEGQQVFRFDVLFGTAPASPHPRDTDPTQRTAVAGPYTVTLSTLLLDTGEGTVLTAHIAKNGKPADDLQPYLGVPAHAVFIDARDLSYLHVHPLPVDAPMGEMHDMQMPQTKTVNPTLLLRVHAPQADTYKLWLQFQGGGQVYVAPFVLVAH